MPLRPGLRRILLTSVKRVTRQDPTQLPVPHDLQRGNGHHHPPLGGGGGATHGCIGGTLPVDTEIRDVLLFQLWPHRANPTREATEGIWRPKWPL